MNCGGIVGSTTNWSLLCYLGASNAPHSGLRMSWAPGHSGDHWGVRSNNSRRKFHVPYRRRKRISPWRFLPLRSVSSVCILEVWTGALQANQLMTFPRRRVARLNSSILWQIDPSLVYLWLRVVILRGVLTGVIQWPKHGWSASSDVMSVTLGKHLSGFGMDRWPKEDFLGSGFWNCTVHTDLQPARVNCWPWSRSVALMEVGWWDALHFCLTSSYSESAQVTLRQRFCCPNARKWSCCEAIQHSWISSASFHGNLSLSGEGGHQDFLYTFVSLEKRFEILCLSDPLWGDLWVAASLGPLQAFSSNQVGFSFFVKSLSPSSSPVEISKRLLELYRLKNHTRRYVCLEISNKRTVKL